MEWMHTRKEEWGKRNAKSKTKEEKEMRKHPPRNKGKGVCTFSRVWFTIFVIVQDSRLHSFLLGLCDVLSFIYLVCVCFSVAQCQFSQQVKVNPWKSTNKTKTVMVRLLIQQEGQKGFYVSSPVFRGREEKSWSIRLVLKNFWHGAYARESHLTNQNLFVIKNWFVFNFTCVSNLPSSTYSMLSLDALKVPLLRRRRGAHRGCETRERSVYLTGNRNAK